MESEGEGKVLMLSYSEYAFLLLGISFAIAALV